MASGFTKPPSNVLAIELAKQRALKTLGMGPVNPFKKCDVMTYFRMKAKKLHPDTEEFTEMAGGGLQELREAKDLLIKWLGEDGDGSNI